MELNSTSEEDSRLRSTTTDQRIMNKA